MTDGITPDPGRGGPGPSGQVLANGFLRRVVTAIRRVEAAPLPWTGTKPFRPFLLSSLLVVGVILVIKVLLDSPIRLQVYVLEVAVVLLLGFAVLERTKASQLRSRSTGIDLAAALLGGLVIVLWNLRAFASLGYRGSVEPGFIDAIALVLVLFVASYGSRNVRPLVAPLSLLILLGGITTFISNEDPAFYALIGRHFVSLTVGMSAGLLSWMDYPVVAGADSFRILGTPSLTVEIGIRCGGLDVTAMYALLIAYFAWQTRLNTIWKSIVVSGVAFGALLLNALRVVVLTILFLNYPVDLVEAVHTNLGDLVFLGYALVFILILQRYRRAGAESEPM